MLEQVCRIALEEGGLLLAWIGWHDVPARLIRSVVAAAADKEPLPEIAVSTEASRTEARGPASTAFREQKTTVCDELSADTRANIRKESAARSGVQSGAAIPLRRGGQVWGVLCLYAGQPRRFVPQEVAIWEDLAADLAAALPAAEAAQAPKP